MAEVEIACGLLIVFGLLTRLAALPLIIDMLVAIATTKVPILIYGQLWSMAHEARLDVVMLVASCVLLAVGAGAHSIDAWLLKHLGQQQPSRMSGGAPNRWSHRGASPGDGPWPELSTDVIENEHQPVAVPMFSRPPRRGQRPAEWRGLTRGAGEVRIADAPEWLLARLRPREWPAPPPNPHCLLQLH